MFSPRFARIPEDAWLGKKTLFFVQRGEGRTVRDSNLRSARNPPGGLRAQERRQRFSRGGEARKLFDEMRAERKGAAPRTDAERMLAATTKLQSVQRPPRDGRRGASQAVSVL